MLFAVSAALLLAQAAVATPAPSPAWTAEPAACTSVSTSKLCGQWDTGMSAPVKRQLHGVVLTQHSDIDPVYTVLEPVGTYAPNLYLYSTTPTRRNADIIAL